MKRFIVLCAVMLASAGVYFLGCGIDNPVDTENAPGQADHAPRFASTEFSTVLVPDGDVPQYGWIPHPITPPTRYDKIDEGTGSTDGNIIYTQYPAVWDRFTFTDISGYDEIDAEEIVFTIPLNIGLGNTPIAAIEFWYYINGTEEGYAIIERYYGEWESGDSTWVLTFDDVCYDLDDINSLEVKINTTGASWDPASTLVLIHAIDADVKYDTLCVPEISIVGSNRNGNTVTVTWDTECPSTSKVLWGYSELDLSHTATGASGTDHSVSFAVGATEGCIYFKAVSAGLTCSAPSDTSTVRTDVTDVVISNVSRSFNPVTCEIVVSWTTNVKSSSKVYWGYSCLQLNNTSTGMGGTTSHTVHIDVGDVPVRYKVYTVPESASGCDTAQGGCAGTTRNYCVQEL